MLQKTCSLKTEAAHPYSRHCHEYKFSLTWLDNCRIANYDIMFEVFFLGEVLRESLRIYAQQIFAQIAGVYTVQMLTRHLPSRLQFLVI
jgi:hypothetical protein